MEKSQSIKNIAKALMVFHLKVEKIKKDKTNPFFKSTYATLSNILDSIDVPLSESGLSFTQFPIGKYGLCTLLMHADSGEYMQSEYYIKPSPEYAKEKDKEGNVIWRSDIPHVTPQGIGSAITYQRRYALAAILGLNIDDDDDANAATHGNTYKKSENAKSEDNKAWLNEGTKEYEGALQKMKEGKSSIDALRKYFKISKSVETKLLEASKK